VTFIFNKHYHGQISLGSQACQAATDTDAILQSTWMGSW
jgi:hypothetical protein